MIMLYAVAILCVLVVALVVWQLCCATFHRGERSWNASELIEEVSRNRLLTCQGDVVFCYRLTLPECGSLSEAHYERLFEIWRVALKDLPQGTIVLRSDRYDRRPFDAEAMPGRSYIQREEKRYAESRMMTADISYLFVVFTGFRATRDAKSRNPFVRLTHAALREEDREYVTWTRAVDSMYQQLQGSGLVGIDPLTEAEVREYGQWFFNGFQTDYLTDVTATEEYVRAAGRYIGGVSLEHERQFPEVLHSPQPGRNMRLPLGILEELGILLPVPHLYNQVIRITGHEQEYALVKQTLETFRRNRGFSDEHEDQARRLDKTREAISDDLDAMLVRGHTNILFWGDTAAEVREYRTRITNYLRQSRDFEPAVPAGAELRNVVFCSHPATIACMDRDSYYLVDIRQALALFQNTGRYVSDSEGVFFSDPVNHLPLRHDLYDAHKKYVDSRNIAVIGRTGGGKTVDLEKIVGDYHYDTSAGYVNIIIDCGGSYEKAARLYDSSEVFIFRYVSDEPLGLDPFAVADTDDAEHVDDICETLWLVIKPGGVATSEERVSLRKIVKAYLKITHAASWQNFYEWVSGNYEQILANNEIRSDYFDVRQFVHNGSEWSAGGIYANVFSQSDDPTTRLRGKRFLIFELENIRQNPQLLSIVVHLIGIAIRTLVWEQPGKRGFIIYEEFAELMKDPVIFSAVLYQMQAIRKKGGSACIVLQNLDQLALNAGDRYSREGGAAGALMKNIETVIFLAGADPTGFEKYAPGFTEHDRQCVLSLKNNFTTPPMYSSFYIYRSKKSMLMSLCISPRTFLAYQTEGEICDELGRLLSDTGSMEKAIERYEQLHDLNQ